VISQRRGNVLELYALRGEGEVVASGRAVGEKIAAGTVRVVHDLAHLAEFRPARSWSPTPPRRTGSR